MTRKEKDKKYEYAFRLIQNESSVLWNSSNAFLVANTIILAVVTSIRDKENSNVILLGVSVFGFLITLLWLFSYSRRSDYYKFHMAQAKEVEPPEWKLLADIGEKFSNGKQVEIEGKDYQLKCLSSVRTVYLKKALISIFLVGYFFLFLYAFKNF